MTTAPLSPLDLDQVVRSIDRLPSPPVMMVDLLQAIDDEDSSRATLEKSIARHHALVARLLRMANSSFYGMQGKVDTIPAAITVLGLRTVRTLAITMVLQGRFAAISVPGFDLEGFWRHSIATALAARAVARRMHLREGSAFVSGLLHDVGQLVLASSFPDQIGAVARYRTDSGCFMREAEQIVLGMDHARIGCLLSERWHFPQAIRDAIDHHHHPEEAGSELLASVVHLGDAFAHALDLAGSAEEVVPSISPLCWRLANLSWSDNQEIFAEIEREFASLSQVETG